VWQDVAECFWYLSYEVKRKKKGSMTTGKCVVLCKENFVYGTIFSV